MAAELSTLASSFLETKPETYAPFFLECVESKQHLNIEKIPDGWIGKVNNLLNSKNDSWLGVCLLGITVEQCDTGTFRANCSSWLRSIIQIIQTPGKSSVLQYCSKLLDDVLKYAAEFSELSRELSNSVIPSIISTLLSNKCPDEPSVLSMLSSCVRYFPGPSGPSRNQIEKFLLPHLNSPCDGTVKAACECYALLPRCSRSGSNDKRQACPWETQWNKVLCTIHKLLDVAYENVEPVATKSSQNSETEVLPLGDVPQVEPERTHTLVTRCNTLLHCLSAMIREEYLKVVPVPIDATINLLTRIMAVTNNSLKNAVVVESVLLRASLPLIHTNAIDLLTKLVTRCKNLVLPYYDLLMKVLVQELTWTKSQDPAYGHNKPYRRLKCSVFRCIECWVQVTNSLPEEGGLVSKLMQLILDDIKPLTPQTKLLPNASSGNQQLSKKAKKRKMQDDVDQLLTGQQKIDNNANENVTYRALKAVCAVLIAVGNDIPQDLLRDVQVVTVKLIMQCQQSLFNTFPIPYSSADCRQELYHVLLICLLTNSPHVPPPVNHAARLFSSGLQDIDFKVSSFCQEALAVVNSIIHPRSFPQVCSAPGPLLLNTSEHPSLSEPLSTNHESTTEMCSSITFDQVTNRNASLLQSMREEFESSDVNSAGHSQTEQISKEMEKYKASENTDNISFTSVGNQTGEEFKQNPTSENQAEISSTSKRESNLNSEKDKSPSEAAYTDSQISIQTQLGGSSQTSPSDTLLEKDLGFSPEYGNICDSENQLGFSEPKRRRIDNGNFNSTKGIPLTNNTLSTAKKDQLTESVTDNDNTIFIEDSDDNDETAQMIAAFVDSYPDSDEPEFS